MNKLVFKFFIIFIIAFCIYSSFAIFNHIFLKSPEPLTFDAVEVEPYPALPDYEEALEETPLLFTEIYYSPVYNIDTCNEFIADVYTCIEQLETAMASGEYTVQAQDEMLMEKARLLNVVDLVEEDICKMSSWEDNYDTKTWKFLIDHGYSEVVASAIIGNMRVETSGGKPGIDPTLGSYYKGIYYYGLCQWSEKYNPDLVGASFEAQLEHLAASMPKEFKTFGYKYKKGFT